MRDADDFEAVVDRELPEMFSDLDVAVQVQQRALHSVAIRKEVHRAPRILWSLAVGDLADLVDDASRGSGRAAMRAARSLIEAAVNMHTVAGSSDDADRYLAHLDLGPVLLAEVAPGHDLLPKKARSQYLHRLRRDAKGAGVRWKTALDQYGSTIQRSWHPVNLKDRATRAGRPDAYAGYRIASLVAHGSAAGATFGQLKINERDNLAFLVGRVPYLCPTALLLGIDAYLEVLKALKRARPEVDISLAWDSLQLVVPHWPEYVALVDTYMSTTWGVLQQNGPAQMTYAGFSRGGRRRWFARTSFDEAKLMHAEDPNLSPEMQTKLETVIEAYRADPAALFNEGGWAALAIPGVAASVDWTRRGIPMTSQVLLVENDDDTWTIYSEDIPRVWRPK